MKDTVLIQCSQHFLASMKILHVVKYLLEKSYYSKTIGMTIELSECEALETLIAEV